MILEYFVAKMLPLDYYIEPINQSVNMLVVIGTMGALDFVVFLIGFFVGLENLLAIRIYLDPLKDWTFDFCTDLNIKLTEFKSKVTDIRSYQLLFSKSNNVDAIYPDDIESGIGEELSENEVKEFYDSDQDSVKEENSFYTFEEILPSPVKPVAEGEKLDEQEIEALIGKYVAYSGDLLGYLGIPLLIIMSWNHYMYIPLFSMYGIPQPSVFLYLMFSVVMIPFQLICDIFLHNSNELYYGLAIHDFLDFMRNKYINRKKRWAGCDPQNEELVEEGARALYRISCTPH